MCNFGLFHQKYAASLNKGLRSEVGYIGSASNACSLVKRKNLVTDQTYRGVYKHIWWTEKKRDEHIYLLLFLQKRNQMSDHINLSLIHQLIGNWGTKTILTNKLIDSTNILLFRNLTLQVRCKIRLVNIQERKSTFTKTTLRSSTKYDTNYFVYFFIKLA